MSDETAAGIPETPPPAEIPRLDEDMATVIDLLTSIDVKLATLNIFAEEIHKDVSAIKGDTANIQCDEQKSNYPGRLPSPSIKKGKQI